MNPFSFKLFVLDIFSQKQEKELILRPLKSFKQGRTFSNITLVIVKRIFWIIWSADKGWYKKANLAY